MKKSKKRKEWDKLYKKAYGLWKEICFKRDGRICQVQKYYPHLNMIHNEVLQVDHFVRRDIKYLHLDPRNGTVVCSVCNGSKKWDRKCVGKYIDLIVLKREGSEAFNEMMAIGNINAPHLEWFNQDYMENKVKELENKLKEIK